jgi:hypothetical protein
MKPRLHYLSWRKRCFSNHPKAVEEDISQEVCWDENAPFITSAISLDHLSEQVKEAALRDKIGKGGRREKAQ